MFRFLVLALVVLTITASRVHPSPKEEVYSGLATEVESVCDIFHEMAHHELIDSLYYFGKVQKRLNNHNQCPHQVIFSDRKHIKLAPLRNVYLKKQAYELTIDESGISISFGDYSGYVYAMESLSQLIKDNKMPHVVIRDQPKYQYRGIMIDTSRHFLQISTIQRLISTMPMTKLNKLHWHMVNDEAFSVKINSHPELSEYGAYSNSMVYQTSQIKGLIALAEKNAVQIIAEIDTISGMRSWVQSPTWKDKNLTINCNASELFPKYCHQVDPSKAAALQLAQDVMMEIDNLFRDSSYLHLGGSKIRSECWDSHPSIKNVFMKLHNIKDYDGLIDYWRFELKQSLPSSRKLIYFMDKVHSFSAGENQIIQFNGNTTKDLLSVMEKTKSKIILSGFDAFDLSTGLGDIWSKTANQQFNTWKSIYENYGKIMEEVDQQRILGAQMMAWGIAINDDNFENSVWMRSAVLGERMWSTTELPTYAIVTKAVSLQRTLQDMGIDVSPVTSEFCEHKPQKCWPEEIVIDEI